jgi:hypothetical protein
MTDFAAEFRDITSIYENLEAALSGILNADISNEGQSFLEATIQHRGDLEQLMLMDLRIQRLIQDWPQHRMRLDPDARQEVEAMISAAKIRAIRLQEICRTYTKRLQSIHDGIRDNLLEVSKGARFARSLKPLQQNYPKFIDSRC